MPQWLYLLYYFILYTVISRQYFKMLGEADNRTEKEERCIFRNKHRVAKEIIYDCSPTQHFVLNIKYTGYVQELLPNFKKSAFLHEFFHSSDGKILTSHE